MATIANTYLQKALSIVVSIGLAASSWFLTQAWFNINEVEKRVYIVELNAATVAGNRISAVDWQTNKAIIDQQIIATQQRVLVLEENAKAVKELLIEIRTDLKELKNK